MNCLHMPLGTKLYAFAASLGGSGAHISRNRKRARNAMV
jgi:hypothetical protein